MKYPNHIILDVKSPSLNSKNQYWVNSYAGVNSKTLVNSNLFLNYTSLNQSFNTTPLASLEIISSFQQKNNTSSENNFNQVSSLTWSLFNINFLRKEKIYTKLKYSRCPQYDMVSGGIAALFSAFLGFLICEKFGLELLDSGDFYIAFMYAVFICFSVRPFLKILSIDQQTYSIISLKFLGQFILDIFLLILNTVRFYWSKFFISHSNNRGILVTWLLKIQFFTIVYEYVVELIKFLKGEQDDEEGETKTDSDSKIK